MAGEQVKQPGKGEQKVLKDQNVADLNRLFRQAKGSHSRFEPIWLINWAYFFGDQWVFYNRGRIDKVLKDPARVMIVDNRIQGIVQTELAKMTKQKPSFQVTPISPSDADLQASLMGEQILEYLYHKLNLHEKLMDALRWSRITGCGFWKVVWDSSLGHKITVLADEQNKPIYHPMTDAPVLPTQAQGQQAGQYHLPCTCPQDAECRQEGEECAQSPCQQCGGNMPLEGAKPKVIATGDVHVEALSPFEIFPDPLAKRLDQCEWLIQSTVKSPLWVLEHYGVEMEPDSNISPTPMEAYLFPTYAQLQGTTAYRGINVREYWCKPNAVHAEGRHVVWAKEKILYEGPNPYGRLPYVMFTNIEVPGRFWPTSVVEALKTPQTELNKIKSQIMENAQKVGNPALMASRQANIEYSGVAGERIDFDDTIQNAIPTYLAPPQLPGYVLQQVEKCEQSIAEISGQREVSNAQVPTGVKAASAIALLSEADESRMQPSISDMEEQVGEAGTMLLEIIARCWTDERVVMIAGENHAYDALAFRGAALKGNTHVSVQIGSQIPRSKAAKQAAIQDILGLYFQYMGNQPLNRRMLGKVLKEYEAGSLEKLFGDTSVDDEQINRENRQMANGDELPINVFDDHTLHVEGHTEFQKSASYMQLPEPIKTAIERHITLHRQRIVAAQQAQGAPSEKHDPVETLAYKDAPPDVKRQIEQQAGLEPSREEASQPPELQAGPQPPEAGAPAGAGAQAPQAPGQPQ